MTAKKSSKNIASPTPRQDAFNAAWERFRPLIPEEELPLVEQSFSKPLPPAFRLNTLKMSEKDLPEMVQRYGWTLEPVPYCDTGYRVINPEIMPSRTVEHRMGQFYIQDSASMLPVELFDSALFSDNPMILDMAASPGGKTTHLICRSQDNGLIFANDSSKKRLSALKAVLKNWGSLSAATTCYPGERLGSYFPDVFDIVLLDAPCSMQSLVSTDSHPMRPVSSMEEQTLAARQSALLESGLMALRPGGQLVYSTCTLSPTEDEAVIDAALKKFGSAISIVDLRTRLPIPAPGLTRTPDITFDPSLAGTARLWPHRYGTAGFFAALIRKNDAIENELKHTLPHRTWSSSGFEHFQEQDAINILNWIKKSFGFDLRSIIQKNRATFCWQGNECWLIPSDLYTDYDCVSMKSAGMRIAVKGPKGWIPDNDWGSRFFHELDGNKFTVEADFLQNWLNGEDIRPSVPIAYRQGFLMMMDENGNFLGFGKFSVDRIRNLI